MTRTAEMGQGIRRVSSVIEALGDAPSGLRLTDVAAATTLTKATAHRLLASLVEVGLVEQDRETGMFHLGFRMCRLGAAAANRYGFSEIARPYLENLANQTGDTAYLAMRCGYDAVCVDRQVGSFPIPILFTRVGDRRPLGVGGGSLAILAFMPDDEIDAALAQNQQQITTEFPGLSVPSLRRMIEEARTNGYAFWQGVMVPEMGAVAVPIRDRNGRVTAALSVTSLATRLENSRRQTIVGWMQAEAKQVESALKSLTSGLTEGGVEALRQKSIRPDLFTEARAPSAPRQTTEAEIRPRRGGRKARSPG